MEQTVRLCKHCNMTLFDGGAEIDLVAFSFVWTVFLLQLLLPPETTVKLFLQLLLSTLLLSHQAVHVFVFLFMLRGKITYMSGLTDKRATKLLNTLRWSTWFSNLKFPSSTLLGSNSSFAFFWTWAWCWAFISLTCSLVVFRLSCCCCSWYLSVRQKFTSRWSIKTTERCRFCY